jgi:HTH-type transcriptional regulator/antitoxin HigA
VFPPGEFIRDEIEARGWTQDVLAEVLGTSTRLVNEVICAKRAVTPQTAQALAEAFGTSASLWMNLESTYRLSLVRDWDPKIARRSELHSKYPVREMCRRRWIVPSNDPTILESRIQEYFGKWPTLAEESSELGTSEQVAWATQAKRIARQLDVGPYTETRLDNALQELRKLLAEPNSAGQAGAILADAGIRLVVVEPIANTSIDGACLWLDKQSPVVALSMRQDRLTSFWRPLLHELDHIRHRDGELIEDLSCGPDEAASPSTETRADQAAWEFIIPRASLAEFTRRSGSKPMTKDIAALARAMDVHPELLICRMSLQDSWPGGRKFFAKVRDNVISAVPTDGWGHLGANS